jgi:hypothetical protein
MKGTKMKRISLIAALALVALALVVAGCGGSSGGGSTDTSTTTASTGGGGVEISAEAKACLKEKGVETPEFKSGEGGPPMGEGGEAPEAAEGGEPPQGAEGTEPPEGGPPAGAQKSNGEGPGGEKFEEMQKAFEECGVETPSFKGGPAGAGGPNVNSAEFRKQVKEYAACVRKNGYELAEPNLSGEGPVFEKSESESAAFKKASEACQNLLEGQGES